MSLASVSISLFGTTRSPCVVRPVKPPLFLFLLVRKLIKLNNFVGTTQLHLSSVPVHIANLRKTLQVPATAV